ncbi:hypothetical protein Y032_0014g2256 [Ancylostoma ceylanicum]|uniref:7TM GPCR serpentine receptor class x (Srx) domain-containing protein n=1 Tax=Ancylostoma ceylanicum TaxID=53326 RepID=A0A016V8K9_9BILA|nr:hypothetical protein Y032_0014g2256 [Ancylostoma ceylanicum]
MKKTIVGSGYLVLSLLGTCLNLSTLSVLPECEKSLTRPLLIFFSIQLFIGIGTLLSVAVPVPYMIATNRAYFVNPILIGAPGLLICLTLLASYLIQFCICIYRNIRVVFNKTSEGIFADIIVQILIALAFLVAVCISANIIHWTNVRRFSLHKLAWDQADYESNVLLNVVGWTSMVGAMFYALSISDLLYEHIYDEEKHESTETTPKTRLLYQILHLVCDIIFCILIVLPRIEHVSMHPNLAIIHSFLTIFGPAVWPTISVIAYSERVRNELCFRTFLMFKACSSQDNIQNRTRPRTSMRPV